MKWKGERGSCHGFLKVTISVFAWSDRNDGKNHHKHPFSGLRFEHGNLWLWRWTAEHSTTLSNMSGVGLRFIPRIKKVHPLIQELFVRNETQVQCLQGDWFHGAYKHNKLNEIYNFLHFITQGQVTSQLWSWICSIHKTTAVQILRLTTNNLILLLFFFFFVL